MVRKPTNQALKPVCGYEASLVDNYSDIEQVTDMSRFKCGQKRVEYRRIRVKRRHLDIWNRRNLLILKK